MEWKTATKEVDHWIWGTFEQLLESLEAFLEVLSQHVSLSIAKDNRTKAIKENWEAIEDLNPECCSWVTSMGPSHTTL